VDAESFAESFATWFLAGIGLAAILAVAGYLLLWVAVFVSYYTSKAWERLTGRPGW
jgi:hypothetical protein